MTTKKYSSVALGTPLLKISGINKQFLPKLKNLGIENVRGLLWHFPRRYEDFSKIYKIAELKPGKEATIKVFVEKTKIRRFRGRKMSMFEIEASDKTGVIKAVWFNQPYLNNTIKEGVVLNLSGIPALREKQLQFSNPVYEILNKKNNSAVASQPETTHTQRIIPIYPETKGLTSRGLRFIIKPIIESIEMEESIPQKILEKENIPGIKNALKKIHFPENMDDVELARRRFFFESIFFLHLHHEKKRKEVAGEKAWNIVFDEKYQKKNLGSLPFALTEGQLNSLGEINKDITKSVPMNRLIQGDVGSGKTVVAILAALQTAEKNFQAAFMAPTEILARQHYDSFKKLFPDFKKGLALITNSESRVFYGKPLESDIAKKDLLANVDSGKIKIIVGTHALIQKNVKFKNLALVIVDEQHRFGINQRKALLHSSKDEKTPHFLSMSATPIPRTMALAIFGDLNLSFIDELPKNRKAIYTKVIPPFKRGDAYKFIEKNIKEGRQAFVICPRIEISEKDAQDGIIKPEEIKKMEIKSVKKEYEKLSKKIFPDLNVGMLHGKMPAKEKSLVMKMFTEPTDGKKIDILVATSMVEVGVDVPNATIMMIESAELFGLAQLYQFRGRVGRGSHKSYCLLFTESSSPESIKRLKLVEKAKNGLELAENDLKIRGPGELLGKSQTGLPDRAMEALQKPDIVKAAIIQASKIFKEGGLKKYPKLEKRLEKFEKLIHEE